MAGLIPSCLPKNYKTNIKYNNYTTSKTNIQSLKKIYIEKKKRRDLNLDITLYEVTFY